MPGRYSQTNSHADRIRYVLNVRFLVRTTVAVVAAIAVLYPWSRHQRAQTAAALLERANEQREKKDLAASAQSLYRYLQLRPEDDDARVQMAEAFREGAVTRGEKARAAQLYATAIGLRPSDFSLRHAHMTLLLEIGDWSGALASANEVLHPNDTDAEALRIKALALFAQWHLRTSGVSDVELVDASARAVAANPSNCELPLQLARLYRTAADLSENDEKLPENVRRARAETVLNEMIQRNLENPEAYLGRYLYKREYSLDGAEADLKKAVALDAQHRNYRVQLAAGSWELGQRQASSAADAFRHAIELSPTSVEGHLGLVQALLLSSENEQALAATKTGLRAVGKDNVALQAHLATIQMSMDRMPEAKATIDALEQQLSKSTGSNQLEQFTLLDRLRAQMSWSRRDYAAFIPTVKRLLSSKAPGRFTIDSAPERAKLLLNLGAAYQATQQWDQAAIAYRESADLQPLQATPRLAAAAAWANSGRLELAINEFEAALRLSDVPPEARIEFARLRLAAAQSKGELEKLAFEQALASAFEAVPDAPQLHLLSAAYQNQKGDHDLARQSLQRAENSAGSQFEILSEIALGYERISDSTSADRVLALAATHGGAVKASVLTARLQAARSKFDDAEKTLMSAASASPENRPALMDHLATLYLARGQIGKARTALESQNGAGNDLRRAQILAQLALDDDDLVAVRKHEQALERIEGADGTTWRYVRAQRLLKLAADPQAPQRAKLLAEASQLQERIVTLRPDWPAGHLLRAQLAKLDGDKTEAVIDAYVQAIRCGESRLRVFEELIFLLYRENRLAEAEAYLEKVRQASAVSESLTPVAIAVDVKRGNTSRAVELAEQQLAKEPDKWNHHLRLGQLLFLEESTKLTPDFKRAEAELVKANEVGRKELVSWSALIMFYGQTRNVESLRTLLAELETLSEIDAKEKLPQLAQGYAWAGDGEKAEGYYRECLEAFPNRSAIQLSAGRFFLQRDKAMARQCFERALALEPENDFTRRQLAVLISETGRTDDDLERLTTLLTDVRASQSVDLTDQRLKAVLLYRRGGSELQKQAREILEQLIARPSAAAAMDRLLLARICESQGDVAAAEKHLSSLASASTPAAQNLAVYVDFLLRNNRTADAQQVFEQLEQLEPSKIYVRTLLLGAKLLKQQESPDKIKPLVGAHRRARLKTANSKSSQAQVVLGVASVFSEVGLSANADSEFKAAAQLDSRTYPIYAKWLVKEGRASEALQLCINQLEGSQNSQPAITLCSVLMLAKVPAVARQDADKHLTRSLVEFPMDSALTLALANLHLTEGDNDSSIKLLRRTLHLDPNNLEALNNLAMLLADDAETRLEALRHAERALQIAGPQAELLDTKAWVLIKNRHFDQAVAALTEVLEAVPHEPRYRFHLAIAQREMGKLDQARESLETAQKQKLSVQLLSSGERQQLAALQSELGLANPTGTE